MSEISQAVNRLNLFLGAGNNCRIETKKEASERCYKGNPEHVSL